MRVVLKWRFRAQGWEVRYLRKPPHQVQECQGVRVGLVVAIEAEEEQLQPVLEMVVHLVLVTQVGHQEQQRGAAPSTWPTSL